MRRVSGALVGPLRAAFPGSARISQGGSARSRAGGRGAQLLCGDKLRNAGRQWGLELEFEDRLGGDLEGLPLGDELNSCPCCGSSHRADCSPLSPSGNGSNHRSEGADAADSRSRAFTPGGAYLKVFACLQSIASAIRDDFRELQSKLGLSCEAARFLGLRDPPLNLGASGKDYLASHRDGVFERCREVISDTISVGVDGRSSPDSDRGSCWKGN